MVARRPVVGGSSRAGPGARSKPTSSVPVCRCCLSVAVASGSGWEAGGGRSRFGTCQVGQPQNVEEFEEQVLSEDLIAVQDGLHHRGGGREPCFVRPPHGQRRRQVG